MKTSFNFSKGLLILSLFILSCFAPFVYAQKDISKKYISKDAGFSILFPAPFTKKIRTSKQGQTYSVGAIKGNVFFEVRFGIEKKPLPLDRHDAFIKKIKENYISKGKVENEKTILLKNNKGTHIEFLTEDSGTKTFNFLRIFVKNNIWYTIKVFSNKNSPPLKEIYSFLNSFQFLGS